MEAKGGREWFYRLGEVEFGPITWTELRRLVHSGKISRRHEVRICRDSHAGQWRPISTISHLLPELTDEAHTAEAEVRLEQQIISEMRRSAEPPPKPISSVPQVHKSTTWGTASSPRQSWSYDPVFDTLNGAHFAFLETLEKLVRLTRRFAVPLVCLTLWMSVNAIYWVWASAETELMQVEKVELIGKRYFELRKSTPDKQAWGKFVVESKKTLQPLIASFKRRASADRPIQQHLLWASRDCLIVMLERPWGEAETQEKSFSTHMREVRNKLRQANIP